MAQVVFLTDSLIYGELGSSRYMGPYVLASHLERAGFSTQVIDYFTQKENFFEFLKNFIGSETLAIGISTTFLTPVSDYFTQKRDGKFRADAYHAGALWLENELDWISWSKQLRSLLSEYAPKAKIILGGTKAIEFCFNPSWAEHIDYFVFGAADISLINCVEALNKGEVPAVGKINGLNVLKQFQLKNQGTSCPTTDYQKHWHIQPNEALPIEISRGCIFNCKFCYYEKKASVRKNKDLLLEEMTRNYELFGTTVYHFTDDCFNDSREKVETLCESFLKLPFQIEWVSYARVDVAVRFPETAKLMVESGAASLFWGLESFHAEAARKAGKGTPPEKVKEFLVDFKRNFGNRCFSFGSFIVGLPGEPAESILDTLNWIMNHEALHSAYFAVLGLAPYNENLDKLMLDYADYSRDPQKYGFSDVSMDLSFWQHEHMNSRQAAQLAEQLNKTWLSKRGVGLFSATWQYPHFRTLGFSKEQIFQDFTDNDKKFELAKEVSKRNVDFMLRYWKSLLNPGGKK